VLICNVLCNFNFCFKFSGIGTKVKATNLSVTAIGGGYNGDEYWAA
jgi:hypothetical protein